MSDDSTPFPSRPALRVRLRFSPALRELLVTITGRVHAAQAAASESGNLPAPQSTDLPDPEWQAVWSEGLRERENYDTRALLALISNPQFGTADLMLAPPAAEAVARGSVRVRLHLRETLLRDLDTEEIDGDLDVYRLPPAEQQGYACFRLLAHLEEALILQLDPGLAKN